MVQAHWPWKWLCYLWDAISLDPPRSKSKINPLLCPTKHNHAKSMQEHHLSKFTAVWGSVEFQELWGTPSQNVFSNRNNLVLQMSSLHVKCLPLHKWGANTEQQQLARKDSTVKCPNLCSFSLQYCQLKVRQKKGQPSNLCVYEQTHFKVYMYDLTYMEEGSSE